MTAGIPPGDNSHLRGLRGDVIGWTDRSTRSNTRFLYSVDETRLHDGASFALSLTVRDCPPTSDGWHRIRRAFIERLRRIHMTRAHWLTEWQRRGVPHLHMAVWFDQDDDIPYIDTVCDSWLEVTSEYRSHARAQHVTTIRDAVGWFQYLSKHAVRGLRHYQRAPENIPAGWRSTGRMWGKLGDWPIAAVVRLTLEKDAWPPFRRAVRNWRIAQARQRQSWSSVRAARRMLQAPKQSSSAVRGLSEWLPIEHTLTLVDWLRAAGYRVEAR